MKILEYIWIAKEKIYDIVDFINKNLNNDFILPLSSNCMYNTPSHCVLIKKAVVTPSKIYLIPPTIETTNRVIRKFSRVKEGFLRVVFSDEDLSKIGSNIEECKLIYNRIYTVLRNGLKFGDRTYEFLAFSSSQLREHSCWFYSPTKDKDGNLITSEIIRSWTGDFSKIATVAKFAARMGQCFSSTVDSEKINVESVEIVSDISRNGHVFSDGVGTISYLLMKQITNTFNSPTVPSAVQFRFGGAKGVLSLDMNLRNSQIKLRPSQIKFESKHNILEIVRLANYSPCYLNRQVITLLTTLGVTDEVFIRMQKNMVSELNQVLQNENIARKLLTKNPDEYGVTQSAVQLIKAGFMKKKDPYLSNFLQLFRVISLRDLKKKSRIYVERGAILMGILDETNTLGENEIYLKISNPQKPQHSQVVLGQCAVTRNPCFHPGDIRVVQAVNNDNLKHILNCVVFSQKGECIPALCSGGDLDGDLYSIIWDQRLIPIIKNCRPMNYSQNIPESTTNIKINDVKQFFVNYMVSDNLGQIANAHLVHSDKSDENAFDPICLKLAELHSKAVDFPKTGIPAEFLAKYRVREYPDFMEKTNGTTYKSKKVIGVLYRSVSYFDFQLYENFICDIRLKVEGFKEYVNEALELKTNYDLSLSTIMNQYGIKNEIEVVTGFITNYDEQIKKKYYDVKKLVMTAVKNLKSDFRTIFEKEFYIPESTVIAPEKRINALQKASAWYYVTYHPSMRVDDTLEASPTKTMYTFPWVVYDYLIEISFIRNGQVPHEPENGLIDEETSDSSSENEEMNPNPQEANPQVNIITENGMKNIDIEDLENFI